MIEAMPNKARYQVLMDHAIPGQFLFITAFANDLEAVKYAENLHSEHNTDVDVVVLDAKRGSLRLTLSGKRTLTGRSE